MRYSNALADDQGYVLAKKELQDIIVVANSANTLYFYGAGLRSEEFLQIQREGYPFFRKPDAFVITNTTGWITNTEELDGIPIYTVDEVDLSGEDICVVVIAMDIYHEEIRQTLLDVGCNNMHFVTNDMEHIITRDFLEYYFEKNNIYANFLPFDRTYTLNPNVYQDKVHTFSVMCEKDAALRTEINNAPWVSNIQAGACNATNIVAEYRDDMGENISELNSYYNELTGLYWVWKNTDFQYTGICHYRRRFESDIVLEPIISGDADILLPLPFVIGHNMYTYYQYCGLKEYFDEMLKVVEEMYPDFYETAMWCTKHVVFIPNNICITNRDILDEYCSFLFGVIDEVEKRMSKRDTEKQKRCWLSEHVSTIFFMNCINRYRVAFGNLIRFW